MSRFGLTRIVVALTLTLIMRADDYGVSKLMRQAIAVAAPVFRPESKGYSADFEKHDVNSADVEAAFNARATRQSRRLTTSTIRVLLVLAAVAVSLSSFSWTTNLGRNSRLFHDTRNEVCPQAPALEPKEHAGLLQEIEGLFDTNAFKANAIESLGGAVKIP